MKELKVLWLEDEKKYYRDYSEAIRTRWKAIFENELNIDYFSRIEDAIKKLALPDDTYQILISDLLFPPVHLPKAPFDKHEPRGLEVIGEARKKRRLLVVAYSVGSTMSFPKLHEQALKAGAHIFRYLAEIFGRGGDIRAFCEEIYDHLLKEGIVEDTINLEYDKSDPRISYIVHEVEERKLKSLYRKIVGKESDPQRLVLTYVAPGMSGAFVIKASSVQLQKPAMHHLLKLSRNKQRLSKEIQNYPKPGIYASRLLVNYLGYDEKSIAELYDEWYGIGTVFEEDTKPMLEWLQGSATEEDISDVMDSLFLDGGLRNGYKDPIDYNKPKTAPEALGPNLSRQARISLALKELEPVIKTPNIVGKRDWDAGTIKKYLMFKQLGNTNEKELPDKCFQCLCHGDLHTRNILVRNARPHVATIIDTSDFGAYHWAADYSRLIVDMILAAYDYGIKSYEWNHLNRWLEICTAVIRRTSLPGWQCKIGEACDQVERDKNKVVGAAIKWMIDNFPKICPAVETTENLEDKLWEIQLALAVEFMRGSYRSDLTAPKRVLALLAAHEALLKAESSFHEILSKK